MVRSIGSVFENPSTKLGKSHAQYLVVLLGKGKVIIEIINCYGKLGHKAFVYQGLISVGIKTSHTDHIDLGTKVPLDQSGQQSQLSGKTIVLILNLVGTPHIGLVYGASILVGYIGYPSQKFNLITVHAIVEQLIIYRIL